ncbi:pathogenicity protein [Fusarium pseudoanthophilum]|uniref:Pathogenicity protein n=1 Tax=Fusarium pseudoanthophilum TaxID=48495 RepID=A0A8H5L5X5_9HYPO|nr:pathogenicity protein [Fusarium pseudoanthophilum]
MRFPIATTVLLSNGIAAMPWSFANYKHSENEEITLRIKVSQSSPENTWSHKGKGVANANTFCKPGWRGCWPEEHECPNGWYPVNFDDAEPCWGCCDGGL